MTRRALILLSLAACSDSTPGVPDARPPPPDAPAVVDAASRDSVASLSWVDFAASGCASFDPSGPTCRGPAPLTLRFAALSAAPLTTWLWSFGDGSSVASGASPAHVYDRPGSYTVTLTAGGPGGTAQAQHAAFVVVEPVALGGRCTAVAACGSELECVCEQEAEGGADCPASLAPGFCARGCGAPTECGAGAVCADLSPSATPATAGWRRPLCLRGCDGDADCAPGFACRELRAAGAAGWVRGCFAADLLLDDGASCAGADGGLDGRRCASGTCLPLGARGLCATACAGAPCPSYASCATFTKGPPPSCLARCAERPCAADPWLRCEAAVGSGDLGFAVSGTASTAGYCAAKRCQVREDCGLSGTCRPMGGSMFCAAP